MSLADDFLNDLAEVEELNSSLLNIKEENVKVESGSVGELGVVVSNLLESGEQQDMVDVLQVQIDQEKDLIRELNEKEVSMQNSINRDRSSDSDNSDSSDSDSSDSDSEDDMKPIVAKVVEPEDELELMQVAAELAEKINTEITEHHIRMKARLGAQLMGDLSKSLVRPVDFQRALAILIKFPKGRDREHALQEHFTPLAVLDINVCASQMDYKSFPAELLQFVEQTLYIVEQLTEKRGIIVEYTRVRARRVAPNLSAVVGVEVASEFLIQAGGLSSLVAIPSSNLLVLGSKKQGLMGQSSRGIHEGLVAESPLLQHCEDAKQRRKAQRLISNKAALAARQDISGLHMDGAMGTRQHSFIVDRFKQWQDYSGASLVKAMKVPGEAKKQRRGGRLARLRKARSQQSTISKLKNRVKFGEAELVDDFTGEGLGLLGQVGTGITNVQQNKKNHEQMLTKKTKGRVQGSMQDKRTKLDVTEEEEVMVSLPQVQREKHTNQTSDIFDFTASFSKVKNSNSTQK